MKAVCAVLAAGASHRLGVPKQLLQLANGHSLVRHAVRCACESRAERSAVVVGAHADSVIESVAGLSVEVLHSLDPAEGIAASIRTATTWASELGAEALLLCVCDQPLLSASHLDSLLERWQHYRTLVASHYAGERAVPAIFPASYFGELSELGGDQGAAAILRAAPSINLVAWPEGEHDLDTLGDVLTFRAESQSQSG